MPRARGLRVIDQSELAAPGPAFSAAADADPVILFLIQSDFPQTADRFRSSSQDSGILLHGVARWTEVVAEEVVRRERGPSLRELSSRGIASAGSADKWRTMPIDASAHNSARFFNQFRPLLFEINDSESAIGQIGISCSSITHACRTDAFAGTFV